MKDIFRYQRNKYVLRTDILSTQFYCIFDFRFIGALPYTDLV